MPVAVPTPGFVDVNAHKTTFTFGAPVTVSRTMPVILSLRGNVVARSATDTETHTFAVANTAGQVNAFGSSTANPVAYASETISGTGQTMTIAPNGTLTATLVSGAGASPAVDQVVNVGTTNIPVFAFKLTAQNEAQKIRTLKFTVSGVSLNADDVINMRLYRNAEIMPFATGNQMSCVNNVCTFTWTATDNLLPDPIQPGAPVTVYVKADIGQPGSARLVDSFKFLIASPNDITSLGAYSGSPATVLGSPAVAGATFIMPFPVVITGDAPSSGNAFTQVVGNGTQLGRFKVTNYGNAPIALNVLGLTDNGMQSGASTQYSLSYSDEDSSNYLAYKAVNAQSDVFFMNFSAPVTINGGAYRYFTVSIANIGTAQGGDSWNLGVSALGNVKYSVTENNLVYDGNGNGNLLDTINLFADGKPTLGTIVKQ